MSSDPASAATTAIFLSQQQVRPSWTLNGLTLELNLTPNGAATVNNASYAPTIQSIPQGTVFTSMVGTSNVCNPVRLAIRGSTSNWSTPSVGTIATDTIGAAGMPAFGDSVFAVTQSAAFVSTGNCGTANLLAATAAGAAAPISLVPQSGGNVFEQGICQLQQLMSKGFLTGASAAATTAGAGAPATVTGLEPQPVRPTLQGSSSAAAAATVFANPTIVSFVADSGKKSASESHFIYSAAANSGAAATGTPVVMTTSDVANNRKRRKLPKSSATAMPISLEQTVPGGGAAALQPANSAGSLSSFTMYQISPHGGTATAFQPQQTSQTQQFTAHHPSVNPSDFGSSPATAYIANTPVGPAYAGNAVVTGNRYASCLNVSVSESSVLSPTTTIMSPSDRLPRPVPLRPIAAKTTSCGPGISTPCQVAEITTSSLQPAAGTMSPSPTPPIMRSKDMPTPPLTPTTSLPALIPISHHHHNSSANGIAVSSHNNVIVAAGAAAHYTSSVATPTGKHRYSKSKEQAAPPILNSGSFIPVSNDSFLSQHYQPTQQSSIPTMRLVEQQPVSTVPGFQLARETISGQYILIPTTNQMGIMANPTIVHNVQNNSPLASQFLSTANNSSFSLMQQLSSVVGNSAPTLQGANLNIPAHYSSISSTGSMLFQQISANPTQQHAAANILGTNSQMTTPLANSLLISTESATAAINFPYNVPSGNHGGANSSFIINSHQLPATNPTLQIQQPTAAGFMQPAIVPEAAPILPPHSPFSKATSAVNNGHHHNVAASPTVETSPLPSLDYHRANFTPISEHPCLSSRPLEADQTGVDKIRADDEEDEEKESVDSEVCRLTECTDKMNISRRREGSSSSTMITVDKGSSVQDAGNQTEVETISVNKNNNKYPAVSPEEGAALISNNNNNNNNVNNNNNNNNNNSNSNNNNDNVTNTGAEDWLYGTEITSDEGDASESDEDNLVIDVNENDSKISSAATNDSSVTVTNDSNETRDNGERNNNVVNGTAKEVSVVPSDEGKNRISPVIGDKLIADSPQPIPPEKEGQPDFSGLELLLKSIEQVEKIGSRQTTTPEPSAAVAVAPVSPLPTVKMEKDPEEDSDEIVSNFDESSMENRQQTCDRFESLPVEEPEPPKTVNGLEILCALADQRLCEEKELHQFTKPCSPATVKQQLPPPKRKYTRKSHVTKRESSSHNWKKFPYNKYYDATDGYSKNSNATKYDDLKLKIQWAKLQKQYREMHKVGTIKGGVSPAALNLQNISSDDAMKSLNLTKPFTSSAAIVSSKMANSSVSRNGAENRFALSSSLLPRKVSVAETASFPSATTAPPAVRRGPGRPRKNPVPIIGNNPIITTVNGVAGQTKPVSSVSDVKNSQEIKNDNSNSNVSPKTRKKLHIPVVTDGIAIGASGSSANCVTACSNGDENAINNESHSTNGAGSTGDLSPPVLEPMNSFPLKAKSLKSGSTVLSPPTLYPTTGAAAKSVHSVANNNNGDFFAKRKLVSAAGKSFMEESSSLESKTPKMRKYGQSIFVANSIRPCSDDDDDDRKSDLGDRTEGKAAVVQKRKVGRPRKHRPAENDLTSVQQSQRKDDKGHSSVNPIEPAATKTPMDLFVKSIKTKSTSVGIIEAGKNVIPINSTVVTTLAAASVHGKNTAAKSDRASEANDYRPKKIMPKLKAEPVLKSGRKPPTADRREFGMLKNKSFKISSSISLSRERISSDDDFEDDDDDKDMDDSNDVFKIDAGKSNDMIRYYKRKYTDFSDSKKKFSFLPERSNTVTNDCTERDNIRITPEMLDELGDKSLRVLILVGGLFRAGELTAVHAPDLYGIKLDGERERRPHIYSKEEVLANMILEVKTQSQLKSGTRVCAYWSSQYLSLYPGSVSAALSDESDDENFTSVDFDDGDSGRIKISDIRLLPRNFENGLRYQISLNGTIKRKRTSSCSLDEIPIDKQLHSPDSPSFRDRKVSIMSSTDDQQMSQDQSTDELDSPLYRTPKRLCTENSSITSGDCRYATDNTESVSGTASSSPLLQPEGSNSLATSRQERKEKKRLKKKRKSKKSHKHKDGSVDLEKSRKRHRHKHKHHKHRKHRSSGDQGSSEERNENSDYKAPADIVGDIADVDFGEYQDSGHQLPERQIDDVALSIAQDFESDAEADNAEDQSMDVNRDDSCSSSSLNSELDISQFMGSTPPRFEEIPDVEIVEQEDADVSASSLSNKEEQNSSGSTEMEPEQAEEEPNLPIEASQPSTSRAAGPSNDPSGGDDHSNDSEEGDSADDLNADSPNVSFDSSWQWVGKSFVRNRGRAKKEYFKQIKKNDEVIGVKDCALFTTMGNQNRPFIGRIQSFWESNSGKFVKVHWFYHPEETCGVPRELPYPNALFESVHEDVNNIFTISHKCEVLEFKEYKERIQRNKDSDDSDESVDFYYVAGIYDLKKERVFLRDELFEE